MNTMSPQRHPARPIMVSALVAALVALLLAGGSTPVAAQPAPEERPEAPEPPPLPARPSPAEKAAETENAEVQITTGKDGQLIEEYLLNGRVYMVRITPTKAPPYYLYDLDGDGTFETTDPNSPIKTVQWRIAEWK